MRPSRAASSLLRLVLASSIAASGGGCAPTGSDSADSAFIPSTPATPVQGALSADTIVGPRGPVVVRGDSAAGAVGVSADPLQWTGNDVVSRLRQAALAPVLGGSVSQPGFGPLGLRVRVAGGAGEVRAFVFGDANAVAAAQRGFDPAQVPGGGRLVSLLVDNNLAAIIIAQDAALQQRIGTALATSPRSEP